MFLVRSSQFTTEPSASNRLVAWTLIFQEQYGEFFRLHALLQSGLSIRTYHSSG